MTKQIAPTRQERKLMKRERRLSSYMNLKEKDALQHSLPGKMITKVIHHSELPLYQSRGWQLLQITTVAISVQKATIQIERSVLEERYHG
jgi:hypothetical protein